jgi:hypothetical protein
MGVSRSESTVSRKSKAAAKGTSPRMLRVKLMAKIAPGAAARSRKPVSIFAGIGRIFAINSPSSGTITKFAKNAPIRRRLLRKAATHSPAVTSSPTDIITVTRNPMSNTRAAGPSKDSI